MPVLNEFLVQLIPTMSLNKFMHPRNRYKNEKPCFLTLALKYPEFRAHTTQDENGKVFLDFKNAEALRILTICLLKEDFGLTLELPPDRLVPTIPLRLNYIHWLEDIVGNDETKWGLDIGTGASCIYPLLASHMNKWHFLATEADSENFFYASKNVTANKLEDFIFVKQVTSEDILLSPLKSFNQARKFDFCMCNPPFFADHMEAQAVTNTRSEKRPDASSVSTASPQECIALGGEVGFVRQMIEESTVLRDTIRVYTSMVGKKSSLSVLKQDLKHHKVVKFSTSEFCQGKTMRWGIAWTYDETIHFPRSTFETRKEKPPLQFVVPKGAGGVLYKVHEIAAYLQGILESIKIHCYQGKKAKSYTSITLTATENTWCHQRRLRRQQRRQENQPASQSNGHPKEGICNDNIDHSNETLKRPLEVEESSSCKRFKTDGGDSASNTVEDKQEAATNCSPIDYILKCVLRLKLVDEQVLLELEWLDGKSRELMHQVLTFIKNKLTTAPISK